MVSSSKLEKTINLILASKMYQDYQNENREKRRKEEEAEFEAYSLKTCAHCERTVFRLTKGKCFKCATNYYIVKGRKLNGG